MDRRVEYLGSLVSIVLFFYLYAWQGWSMEDYVISNHTLPIFIGLTMPLWAVLAGISMSLPKMSSIRGIDWLRVYCHGIPAFFLAFGPQLNYLFYVHTGFNILAIILPTPWIFFLDKIDLPMVGGLWLGVSLAKSLKQEG